MNAIYARVSTDDQAKHGYSLEDQINSCRSRLMSMLLTDNQEYIDDGYSGEFLDRPELDRLREDLRRKLIETVIVYDPDRLSRNLVNQLLIADEIEKAGARLLFVTGDFDCSPEGRLFFSIRGAFSEYERAKIRDRTTRGVRAKVSKGKIIKDHKPYGFNWDEEKSIYTINENEAETVKLIYDLCIKHHYGVRAITKELRSMGIMGRNKPLSHGIVYRVLSNELYSGTVYQFKYKTKKTGQYTRELQIRPRDEWQSLEVPAIVSKDTWLQAQKVLKENFVISGRNTQREYLLKGLLKCGICGRGMVAFTRKSGNKEYGYYTCVTNKSNHYVDQLCKSPYFRIDQIEELVWNTVLQLVTGEDSFSNYMQIDEAKPNYSDQIERLVKRKSELRKEQIDIMRWYRDKILDSQAAEKELQKITKELNVIESTLSVLKNEESKSNDQRVDQTEIVNASSFDQKRNALVRLGWNYYVTKLKDQSLQLRLKL